MLILGFAIDKLPDNRTFDDFLHWDLKTDGWTSQLPDPVTYDLVGSLSSLSNQCIAATPGTMNFPMFSADELNMTSGSSLSDQSVSDPSVPDEPAPPGTEPGQPSLHEQWIRKISDLNITLYQHAALIPPVTSGNHRPYMNGDSTMGKSRTVAIDQTFAITAQVLKELEAVSSHSRDDGARSGVDLLDQGSLLLILSLYLRLLDIYHAIFEPLQRILTYSRHRPSSSCSSNYPPSLLSAESPTSCPEHSLDERLPLFPVLRIGEFSLQASTSIHTLMTVQLAEQLLSLVYRAVQNITRKKSAASTPFRYDKQDYFMGEEHRLDRLRDINGMDVADSSLKAVEKRQMEVMAMVKAIKWGLGCR